MELDTETIIGTLGMLIVVVVGLIVAYNQDQKLDDPKDESVVYLDKLQCVSKLGAQGTCGVRIIRQSGNPQQDDRFYPNSNAAISAAVSTFRRANIPYVVVESNTHKALSFRRPYHSGRGVKEGKKVGGAVVMLIEDP